MQAPVELLSHYDRSEAEETVNLQQPHRFSQTEKSQNAVV